MSIFESVSGAHLVTFSEQAWTKAELRRAAVGVSIAVLVATGVLLFAVDWNVERRKAQQKLERLDRDFTIVRATLEQLHRMDGVYPTPTQGNRLPESIARQYADERGGAPYYEELGRYLRLDLFSPGAPHREPLAYYLSDDGENWLIVSRGPDVTLDLGAKEAQVWDINHWKPKTYDPTNGILSEGDVWVSSMQARGY